MEILFTLFLVLFIRLLFFIFLIEKKSKVLYINDFLVYNGMMYWLSDNVLYRAEYKKNKESNQHIGKVVDQNSDLSELQKNFIIQSIKENKK